MGDLLQFFNRVFGDFGSYCNLQKLLKEKVFVLPCPVGMESCYMW